MEPDGSVLGRQEPLGADTAAAVARARTARTAFAVADRRRAGLLVPGR